MAHENVSKPAFNVLSVSGGSANKIDLTPKYAVIADASSGDNTIVAAVASHKIVVLNCAIIASGAVNIYFVDGANTAMFGDSTNKIALTTNSGFVLPQSQFGWMETASGQSLDINLSAATAIAGGLTYVEVPA